MKPNSLSINAVNSVNSPLTAVSTAKIVRHPQSKKSKEVPPAAPDEETLMRLNAMAKQYPFCIRHKGNNSQIL